MTNFETARRFTGLTASTLADLLGVSPQHLNGWLKGERTPNRNNAEDIARKMDIDAAWLLGVAQILAVVDPIGREVFSCKILRTEEITDYGCLYHVWHDEIGHIIPVINGNGVQFTPCDWEAEAYMPKSAAEIAYCKWMDNTGRDAVMIDGLPRAFV